jgi:transcriptional regulator with XRE-family HTH domain
MDTLEGKQMMAARLKYYMDSAHISVPELEKQTKIYRSHLYKILEGKANFSIDLFEKLLKACGVTLAEFLTGMHAAEDRAQQDESIAALYRMLDMIVKSRITRQIEGTRVQLENASLNVQRLLRAPRASPNPTSKSGQDAETRTSGGSPRKKKRAV